MFASFHSAVCVPFPKQFQLSNNTRDYSALQHCLDTLPSLSELCKLSSQTSTAALKEKLTSQQRELLEWTLASHPRRKASAFQPISLLTFLKEVPPARLTGSHASNPSLLPHAVFKLQPQAQANFADSNAAVNGFEDAIHKSSTVIAFHGTSFENLHSIIRSGLVPASGTKLERNGKTYGEGIYLSTELPVAYSFCNGAERWKGSSLAPDGTRLRCILVCGVKENATKDETEIINKNGDQPPEHYLVIDRPDLVKILYILVYVDHCGNTRGGRRGRNLLTASGQQSLGGAGGGGWAASSLFPIKAIVVLIAFIVWLVVSGSSSSRKRYM